MNANSLILLERQLSLPQLKTLIANKKQQLPKFMARYGEQTTIHSISEEKARTFRHNYQAIIHLLNKERINTNDYSMHLLITLNLYYLALQKTSQAKEALKKALDYVDINNSDPVLQAICLNNLTRLYKQAGKYWKCLKYSLKGVQIIWIHLHESKDKSKDEKQEIAVLLIGLLNYARSCSKKMMKTQQSRQIRQYNEFANYLGYRTCIKYLGKESIFNKFESTDKYFHLPVFKTDSNISEANPKEKDRKNQNDISNQLSKIYDILKAKKDPQYVIINASQISQPRYAQLNKSEQSVCINNQINEVTIQKKQNPKIEPLEIFSGLFPPKLQKKEIKEEMPKIQINEKRGETNQAPKSPPRSQFTIEKDKVDLNDIPRVTINQESIQNQASIRYVPSQSASSSKEQEAHPVVISQESASINKWQIKFRLQKQRDQRLGNLIIESFNKKQIYREVIEEEKLQKIMAQINLEDRLAYEIVNDQFVEEEFIDRYIKPFCEIHESGKFIIRPHSIGLFQPLQKKFLNQESFIFMNHIRSNLFRVGIAPIYSCKSIYLNVELSEKSVLQFFAFDEEVIDFVSAIFKNMSNQGATRMPSEIKGKNQVCKIINQQGLIKYILEIIEEFEKSLQNREDETSVNEIIENELLYYKYQEIKKHKLGIYYFIRYLPSINYFDIYIKNNYQTYSPDSKVKSRGNALYKSLDFLQDFGISLKASKKHLFAYIEIIAKKYYLLTFDKPLTENDNDRYMENAILELPITENCFKTKLFLKNNYLIPITISLLTINSETPVGIKIAQYDPITSITRGFFIHIVSNEWVRPYQKPTVQFNNILFRTYVNQYPFRNHYFLPEWLQKVGFNKIFEKIMDPMSSLYLQENVNKLVRGKILVKIFNNENST